MDFNSKKQERFSRDRRNRSAIVENMKWNERLKEWRQEKGWDMKVLAQRSGVHYDSVAKYEAGAVAKPRGSQLHKLASAFGRTEQELLFGVAEPSKTTNYVITSPSHSHQTLRIPRVTFGDLARHQAGHDILSIWSGDMSVVVDDSISAACFAVEVEDNSMLPDFSPGDMLVCDPAAAIEPGKYVIAKANGSAKAVFRKYRLTRAGSAEPPSIELKPLNEDYPTHIIDADHPGHVIGRAIAVIKRI